MFYFIHSYIHPSTNLLRQKQLNGNLTRATKQKRTPFLLHNSRIKSEPRRRLAGLQFGDSTAMLFSQICFKAVCRVESQRPDARQHQLLHMPSRMLLRFYFCTPGPSAVPSLSRGRENTPRFLLRSNPLPNFLFHSQSPSETSAG